MSFCKNQLLAIGLSGLLSSLTVLAKHVESNPTSRKPNGASCLAFAFLAQKAQKFNQQKQSIKTARKTAVFAYQRVARSFAESGLHRVQLYPPLLIGGYTTNFGQKRIGQNALYLGKNTKNPTNSQICRTGRSLVVIVVRIAFLCVPFEEKTMPKKRQK